MDHAEARAILELAAAEPDGYARLAAGDTPEAAALAGHLAGCPDCAAEARHLARVAAALRVAVRSMPPPDLKERTLAFVAATGRLRGVGIAPAGAAATTPATGSDTTAILPAAPGTPATPTAPSPAADAHIAPAVRADGAAPVSLPGARPVPFAGRGRPWVWVVATAAAVLIAVVGLAGWWNASSQLTTAQATAADLQEVASSAVEIGAAPDARTVSLDPVPGAAAAEGAVGRLVYSVDQGELVVMAQGLAAPTAGQAYHCWIEDSAGRRELGSMSVSGELAYWTGWSDALSTAGPDSRFGVSLVSGTAPPTPVLQGG